MKGEGPTRLHLILATIARMPESPDLLEGLNDAQREAVTHGEGPLLIVAGAGTGKTTVLTKRYVWLLENGHRAKPAPSGVEGGIGQGKSGLKPENILALTFTEKAAGEMEDRILQMLPNGTYDFWISTFHGFCQRVLEERGLEIGLPNRFKVMNETDGWLLLKRRIDELPLDHYRPLGNPVKFLAALQRHIGRAKDENVSPEEYLSFATDAVLDGDAEVVDAERARLKELADLSFMYRKILRDEGSLDFGDLIQETLRLFRERPSVLKEYRERFPYVLVDEFQDTNWAQYELIKLLAGGPTPGDSLRPTPGPSFDRRPTPGPSLGREGGPLPDIQSTPGRELPSPLGEGPGVGRQLDEGPGVGRRIEEGSAGRQLDEGPGVGRQNRAEAHPANLTVVGDDDQAIYKFRGASLANILQFRDDYPDAKTVALTSNYRSHQEILDAAYGFIKQNNPNRLEVRLADTGLSKQLDAHRGPAGFVRAYWYSSIEAEARAVAERIIELKAEDETLTWNDVAVLVRSNDGAEPFVRALDRAGIPFRFFALRGLYVKPAILDLINLLTLTQDRSDSAAVWRVLHMPAVDLGATDAAELTFHSSKLRGLSLWEACREADAIPNVSEEGKRKIKKMIQWVEKLAADARRSPPMKVLQLAIEETGLLPEKLAKPEREKLETITHLNGFADRVKRYEANTVGPTLKGFLDELRLEIESGEEGALKADPDEGPELVKILTVHASKGLEFRHVFIVSMVDQRFPTRKRPDPIPLPDGLVKERLTEGDAHLEEERRLFYVALTRAKDSVTITGASDYGGTRAKKPSPFLLEAGIPVEEIRSGGIELRMSEPAVTQVSSGDDVDDLRRLYPLKRRFSYTQLAAFRSCPLQYKFAHIYRIPILGSHQKTFGQCMHLTLQDVLKLHLDRGKSQQVSLFDQGGGMRDEGGNGFRVSKEEAVAMFKERWKDEWYPDRGTHDEFYAEGLKAIQAFWEACSMNVPPVKALEQAFDWRIDQHSIKGASTASTNFRTGRSRSTITKRVRQKKSSRATTKNSSVSINSQWRREGSA
jgi:superfamily I DNA/RNA helicase